MHTRRCLPCVHKTDPLKEKILIEIICFLLIVLFVYAALSKLLDFVEFKSQMERSPLLHSLAMPVVIGLPPAELAITILLAIVNTRRTGLIFSLLLLSVFTLYIIYMLLFVKHLPCSCGGILQQLTWKQHIVFNVFFMALSGYGIFLSRNKNIADQQQGLRIPEVS